MNAFLAVNFFISLIRSRLKIISLVGILSIIFGTLLSYILPIEYQSETIILPARHFSVSKMLIEPNMGNQEDYLEIGDDDDLEKLLQIVYSDDLKILLADKLNLWNRWKLEQKQYKLHYLKSKWEHYISFYRTNLGSIRIKVFDRNADTAAIIANSIVQLIDSVQKEMTTERTETALKVIKEEYTNTIARINELEDSLQSLRKLGVYDYEAQVKAISKEYAKVTAKNDLRGKEELDKLYDILKKHGGAYQTWSENLRKYRLKFATIKFKYDQALVDNQYVLPLKYTVQKAIADNKKARPIRWLVVLLCFASSEILILSYIIISSKNKMYE